MVMDSPIAIVGFGLRLPGGCHDGASYWDLLVNKKDARTPIPAERFSVDGHAESVAVKDGYFLEEPIDRFDAGFFSMSQAEVDRLDPQQRLLLEVTYEALENAGEANWRGKDIAVYAGSFGADWAQMQEKDVQDGAVYAFTGRDDFVLANRVSYEFDLHGPSLTVRVACSSGLVALHLACEALQRGECSGALVGAVNLILSPENIMGLQDLGVLSPDASSKTFDASANGYVRAEAINAVYIKRLDDAIRDGNPIRAVIRGTAVNADGKSRGFFNPNPDAHAALIQRAYEKAGILRPDETPFVECHGTGTVAGDPLELSAVSKVLGGDEVTYIGGVKPNIGHGEAASGLNSLIKAVLALEHDTIPPNIKFNTPNPRIPFDESRLTVPTEAISWPANRPKRISVNSFGMGGANAHVIIDAAASASSSGPTPNGAHASKSNGAHPNGNGFSSPKVNSAHTSRNGTILSQINGSNGSTNGHHSLEHNGSSKYQNGTVTKRLKREPGIEQRLLVFSAHNDVSLQKMMANYKDFMERETFSLSDLAYTLSVRRHHWNVRSFSVSDGKKFEAAPAVKATKFKGMLFIFTGQGAQWAGLGRELLRDFESFSEDIRRMDAWLSECTHPPLWKIEELIQDSLDINSAEFAQPVCTAIQIALVNLLQRWNILPNAVVGHSSGEIAAAYAAGGLGMKEALLISYYRGVSTSFLRRPGAMGALGLGRHELEDLLVGNATLACENSRSSVTISGDAQDVQASLDRVTQKRPGVLARKLKVDRAYHSDHMRDVAEFYESLMEPLQPIDGKLSIPFYSSVTGERVFDGSSLGPSYWRSNMENPVLFLSAVESALKGSVDISHALEIGPHSTLNGPFRQICKDLEKKIQYTNTLSRGVDCTNAVLTAMGQLYCQGVMPDFDQLNPPGTTMSNLPPYPWNHNTSYWHESRISKEFRLREYPEHELLGARILGGNDLEPSWRKLLDINKVAWLTDHIVAGDIIFPGAGYIGMVGEAVRQLSKSSSYAIRHLAIDTVMILRSETPIEIVTTLRPQRSQTKMPSTWYDFTISSYDGKKWVNNCRGEARAEHSLARSLFPTDLDTSRGIESADWYRVSTSVGLEYRSAFQALDDIQSATGRAAVSARVRDERLPRTSTYAVHPIAIDQMLQSCIIASYQGQLQNLKNLVIPYISGEVHVWAQEGRSDLRIRTDITSRRVGSVVANGQIETPEGILLQCKDVRLRTLNDINNGSDDPTVAKLQLLEWKPDIDLIDAKRLIHRGSDLKNCIKLVEKLYILCAIETDIVLKNIESTEEHKQIFKSWIERFITTIKANGSLVVENTPDFFQMTSAGRQTLIKDLLQEALTTPAKAAALAITRIYDAAEDIFRGEIEALAVLLADSVLTDFYNFFNSFKHQEFFQLLGHSNPALRILEIGAGTGGFTSTVLPTLYKPGFGCMYSNYTYTDISSGFFKAAKERFQEYPDLNFAKLDIGQDPGAQGFQVHSYDVVMAANALHATPNLHKTLLNCRSLLRPGGRLVLLELCSEAKFVNYIMGFLRDWWLGELDNRPNEPYLQPSQWDTALRKAGFSGIEASITDQESPYQLDAVIISRAVQPEVLPPRQLRFVVSDPDAVSDVVQSVQSVFEAEGYHVSLTSLRDSHSEPADVVSFVDIDKSTPFFQDLAARDFDALIDLIKQCDRQGNRILWLTGPAQIATENPYHAMILGLARSLRLELGSIFATLEFDLEKSNLKDIVQVVGKLQSRPYLSYSTTDCEFASVNGDICIPRFVTTDLGPAIRENMEYTTSVTKRLFVTSPGILSSLQWGIESRSDVLEAHQIEIEVSNASLNSWDREIIVGNIHTDMNLGLECVGRVVGTSPDPRHNFEVGDSVLCWGPGSLSTHVKVDEKYCVKIPDNLLTQGAIISITAFATMIRGLNGLCNLSQDETVLIHAASSSEGIAGIQIAKMSGAEIFVTIATEEQKNLLQKQYGIPESHIFSSEDDSFVSDIMLATNDRGVDVVVSTLTGDLFFESWRCVAEGGSMLDSSKWDSASHPKCDPSILGGSKSFYSFDIVNLMLQKPALAQRLLQNVVHLYENGSIQPIFPVTRFEPHEIKEAFQYLQPSRRMGAVYVEFPEDSTTIKADCYPEKVRVRSDRSYVLVGGFGGLGRAAALWLAERGAGSIIFLSRSASKRAVENAKLFREIEAFGASVQLINGTVTDITTVKEMVATAARPIAGVLHLPVETNDKPLIEMSYEDWMTPIPAKVDGAWNLHNALLSQPMDFFILLSSVYAARGNHGQANYAAANNFLDAFVQYRQRLGLPACAIDLGALDKIGHLVDHPKMLNTMKRNGALFIEESDFLESLELAVRSSLFPVAKPPSLTSSFINRAQFVVGGLQEPLDARAQGLARQSEGHSYAVAAETTSAQEERKNMQTFITEIKANPKSLTENVEEVDTFLAAQILSVVKSLLIFDDDDEAGVNDFSTKMSDLGLDSLIAIQLQNWWRTSMGTQISVLELTQNVSALDLGDLARLRLIQEMGL